MDKGRGTLSTNIIRFQYFVVCIGQPTQGPTGQSGAQPVVKINGQNSLMEDRFVKISADQVLEYANEGFILATKDAVEENLASITPLLGCWDIVKLADGFKIDGKGYGNKILPYGATEALGHALVMKLCKVSEI